MRIDPHASWRTRGSTVFASRTIRFISYSCLLLMTPLVVSGQMITESSSSAGDFPQSTSEGIQKRWNEVGIWGGISFDALGQVPDARFGNLGLRYGRVLAASKTVAFEWTIDAVPVSILTNSPFKLFLPGSPFIVDRTRKTTYGWGASPIGLKFNFRRHRRVQPFAQATGGFLYFNEQVPVPLAARFNFTFDLGGGVQIVNRNRRAFSLGYKYQHTSNGNRATFNPGVDVQMVFAGISIFH
jgi:hypothetical protein